jgi:3'(2'), 5'-bisphosphate nucleotidase
VTPIRVRPRPQQGVVAVASRSHRDAETDAWLAERGIADTVSAGSSLKFCLVAEGKADVYPRFGTTMEWDTAAGHAVLRAAGGRVVTVDGKPFVYGKPGFKNPGFIAEGG